MNPRRLTFHFTLRDPEGRVLDTSRGGAAPVCVEGAGQIIDGLAAALATMHPGETRRLVVPPEQGYGRRDEGLVQRVPRRHLPVGDLAVGDRFQTAPDVHAPVVTIVALAGDEVVLDANHPLAGVPLHFEVELVTARPATAAEIAAARDGAGH